VLIAGVSRDGKWLLYGTRLGGETEFAVTILDIDRLETTANRHLPPRPLFFALSMLTRPRCITLKRTTAANARVYVHRIGSDTQATEIFGKAPSRSGVDRSSPDTRYLVFHQPRLGKQTKSISGIFTARDLLRPL
jgi:hypothetical protein